MNRLSRRLASVEGKLRPKPTELLGTIELHYLHGWPECKDTPDTPFEQCTEHGPTCGVNVSRVMAPIKQVVLLRGGPWLGLG